MYHILEFLQNNFLQVRLIGPNYAKIILSTSKCLLFKFGKEMHLVLILSATPGIFFLMSYFTNHGKVSCNSIDCICI